MIENPSQLRKRVFFTDGSCWHNGQDDAIGACASIEVDGDRETWRKVEGFYPIEDQPVPTSIRMEMMGVLNALRQCGPEDNVTIKSDSAYVCNCLEQKWYRKWERTGKTSTGKVPANLDLWRMIIRAYNRCGQVKMHQVRGHAGLKFNELADEAAGSMVARIRQAIEEGRDPVSILDEDQAMVW